ncbi:MAG: SAM-dependent methyltransferase [Clostridiales bacterium]|nr:SAM-dependent methyltransferase [Clostridiales bacterium]
MALSAMRLPKLDERLELVADCVPKCRLAADIGADHGRLSCYLLSKGRCKEMIVSDISTDSLNKSRQLLRLHGLAQQARFVVADGLDAVDQPVEAVIIAGIGGKTIAGMLHKHQRIGDAKLIISAHTDLPFLRKALDDISYTLYRETVIMASGRYYTVLEAVRGKNYYSPQQLYVGSNLTDTDGKTMADYLSWRMDVVKATRDPDKTIYLEWLNEELNHAEYRNKSNNLQFDQ